MTWTSHLTIGFCLARFHNTDLILTLIGSITPDIIEMLMRPLYKYSYKAYLYHRGLSHSLVLFTVLTALAYKTPVFDLFLSIVLCHLFPDSLNATGVPIWNAKSKYLTLFGGVVRNFTVWEFAVAGAICLFLFFSKPISGVM